MRGPSMILFDYGHTLLHEPDFDLFRGDQALFSHVTANPDGVGVEEFHAFGQSLFQSANACRQLGYEPHEWPLLRTQCEYFGLELDISYPEAERVVWDAASPGAPMPYVEELLAFLRARGIPSGVVSNIGWSGEALSGRLRRLLPDHKFAFILASSEYGIRKPDPRLFRLALRKAGLPADEVWYCGDSLQADVCGAQSAGIFPVYYDDQTVPRPWPQSEGPLPAFDYLHIRDWREMIPILEERS